MIAESGTTALHFLRTCVGAASCRGTAKLGAGLLGRTVSGKACEVRRDTRPMARKCCFTRGSGGKPGKPECAYVSDLPFSAWRLWMSAAVLSTEGEDGGPGENRHEDECSYTIGPGDAEDAVHQKAEQDDTCLVHAEVCLSGVRHHGLAGERGPDPSLFAGKQGHDDHRSGGNRESGQTYRGILTPVQAHASVQQDVGCKRVQAAPGDAQAYVFGLSTAVVVHLMRHTPPHSKGGNDFEKAVPAEAREGNASGPK